VNRERVRERPASPPRNRARSVSSDSDSVFTISTRSSASPVPSRSRGPIHGDSLHRDQEPDVAAQRAVDGLPSLTAEYRSRSSAHRRREDSVHLRTHNASGDSRPSHDSRTRDEDGGRSMRRPRSISPSQDVKPSARLDPESPRYRPNSAEEPRKRSLSPYHKRLAMTQGRSGGV